MADDTPGRVAATLAATRETLHVAEEQGFAEWDDAYLPSALYRHTTSLLAAVERVLKRAGEWDAEAARLDAIAATETDPQSRIAVSLRAQAFQDAARSVREDFTAALTGTVHDDDT